VTYTNPSRGRRTQERAAARGTQQMTVPDHIAALAAQVRPRRPPCPIDPACPVDHLKRKGRRG
jgi:hypothetical protein